MGGQYRPEKLQRAKQCVSVDTQGWAEQMPPDAWPPPTADTRHSLSAPLGHTHHTRRHALCTMPSHRGPPIRQGRLCALYAGVTHATRMATRKPRHDCSQLILSMHADTAATRESRTQLTCPHKNPPKRPGVRTLERCGHADRATVYLLTY